MINKFDILIKNFKYRVTYKRNNGHERFIMFHGEDQKWRQKMEKKWTAKTDGRKTKEEVAFIGFPLFRSIKQIHWL